MRVNVDILRGDEGEHVEMFVDRESHSSSMSHIHFGIMRKRFILSLHWYIDGPNTRTIKSEVVDRK